METDIWSLRLPLLYSVCSVSVGFRVSAGPGVGVGDVLPQADTTSVITAAKRIGNTSFIGFFILLYPFISITPHRIPLCSHRGIL